MFIGDIIIEVLGSEPPHTGLALGSEPPSAGWASRCVWIRLSRMQADDLWTLLMKIPLGDGSRLVASFARKLAASLSL